MLHITGELAVAMSQVRCPHAKTRCFHAVADSAYGGQSVLKHLPANCPLTSRRHLDARIYEPPPERKPGTMAGHANGVLACPRRGRC